MGYQYNIQTSKKDVRSSVCLFINHRIITAVVKLFLSTFLVAHIYSFSNGIFSYILNVGIFEIAGYISLPIGYIITAYFVDKTNRVWIFRIGVIFKTIFVVFAIFYGKQLSKLIFLAGLLNGFSDAVYYAAYNTMVQEMVSRRSVGSFMMAGNITAKVVDVVFPIVLGALIDISTFEQVAVYVFVLCVIQICLSAGIRAKKPENSFFSIKHYFKSLKENKIAYQKMKMIYWMAIVYGFTNVISTIVNICVMIEFGSNFSLGVLRAFLLSLPL